MSLAKMRMSPFYGRLMELQDSDDPGYRFAGVGSRYAELKKLCQHMDLVVVQKGEDAVVTKPGESFFETLEADPQREAGEALDEATAEVTNLVESCQRMLALQQEGLRLRSSIAALRDAARKIAQTSDKAKVRALAPFWARSVETRTAKRRLRADVKAVRVSKPNVASRRSRSRSSSS
mmetsp:Transcript_53468/g.122369  ORF Transcript_53468/g.122369 Transcript_53468/m.122369 type:complete len:178 (+) Transcript_53468:39-572(+)